MRRRRPLRRGRRRSSRRRWIIVAIGIAVLFLAPVLAHAQAPPDTVNLQWTAPGDDGNIGTATLYDLRMSTSPIDLTNWSAATSVSGMPAPRVAGTKQSVTVSGLTFGTTYYFAIRTQDDAGNWSGLSNVLKWDWVVDTAPPAAPTGVSAAKDPGDVHVHWAANTEPDLDGYTVYRALSAGGPYTALNSSLLTTTDYYDTTVPAGTAQAWYQVTASDVSLNESARSATASVTFVAGGAAMADWAIETGYPNPSPLGSTVTLPVMIPAAGGAGGTIVIMDNAGHRVRELSLASLPAGRQLLAWDGLNDAGRMAAPGVYRAIVMSGGQRSVSRLVRVP